MAAGAASLALKSDIMKAALMKTRGNEYLEK